MPAPSSKPGPHAAPEQSCGRPLTVVELLLVLEELDRVVGELALPFDESSRCAARAAIATAARRRGA